MGVANFDFLFMGEEGHIVMKKLFSFFYLVVILTFVSTPIAYCNSFKDGFINNVAMLGSTEIEREQQGILSGKQRQDIFVDKNYDFSKIHKMLFKIIIPNGAERYIDDSSISRTYTNILENAFRGKKVELDSLTNMKLKLLRAYPNLVNMPKNDQTTIFSKFAESNYDAVLTINILGYSQTNGSNVGIEYTVNDIKTFVKVFNDEDFRVQVRNKTKRELLNDMTNKFKSEFFKAVNNSKQKQ